MMPMARMKASEAGKPTSNKPTMKTIRPMPIPTNESTLEMRSICSWSWLGFFLDCLGQVGDPPELGQHAGGIHHRPPGARNNRGAGKDQVGPLDFGQPIAQGSIGNAAGRQGLAGQDGVVDPQAELFHHPGIRRDVVPFGQDQNIPGDDLAGWHLRFRPHPGSRGRWQAATAGAKPPLFRPGIPARKKNWR